MMEKKDFLVELGTEELPPKALRKLGEAFCRGVEQGLNKAALAYSQARFYAAPRRLAVQVDGLAVMQAEKNVERRGPALTAAFNADGMPTPAALGFARSCGVNVEQLERLETDKGAWLVHRSVQPGTRAADVLPGIVSLALDGLPIPKRMRWSDGEAQFVRPVHWLVMLLGDEVVDGEVLGVRAGRESRGHRFHHPEKLYLASPAAYVPLLESEGYVMPDFATRRAAVVAQVAEVAAAAGGKAIMDAALVDEVAALVEWPHAVRGDFDAHFLQLPEQVLIATLQGHQRYFALRDSEGKLLPSFITVANIVSRDVKQVQAGNERVVRPRLEDAMFFFERDLATRLDHHRAALKTVVFQKDLGTLDAKVMRVTALAEIIAQQLPGGDRDRARRAAELSKCDLLSHMVGEFPELQGAMGCAYALAQGEPAEVAQALDEQYLPRYAGDNLPTSATGRALAIADKLDTLCGIFAIGQLPTGDKDPFGLRRAALGVLRIMIESPLDLDVRALLQHAVQPLLAIPAVSKTKITIAQLVDQIFDFMLERLRAYYADGGIRADIFEAVLAKAPTQPLDFDQRMRAVSYFAGLAESVSLAAANKRTHNILKQANHTVLGAVDKTLLHEAQEQALFEQLAAAESDTAPLLLRHDYIAVMTRLAGLRQVVDGFFDKVMVMVDDTAVKTNRLNLLARMHALFTSVADISKLQST